MFIGDMAFGEISVADLYSANQSATSYLIINSSEGENKP
jgi:hypothetical protein